MVSHHDEIFRLIPRSLLRGGFIAIRHLKARYAAYCDDQYNPEGLAALFTEDAVWESQGLGRFEGRDAIREFFRGASQLFTFAIHYSLNGQIDVQGWLGSGSSSAKPLRRSFTRLLKRGGPRRGSSETRCGLSLVVDASRQ